MQNRQFIHDLRLSNVTVEPFVSDSVVFLSIIFVNDDA